MLDCFKVKRIPVKKTDYYEKTARCRNIIYNNGMTDSFIGIDGDFHLVVEVKHTRLKSGKSTVVVYVYNAFEDKMYCGASNNAYATEAFIEAITQIGFLVEYDVSKSFEQNVYATLRGIGVALGIGQLRVYGVSKE